MFLNLYFEAQCTPEFNWHTGKKRLPAYMEDKSTNKDIPLKM